MRLTALAKEGAAPDGLTGAAAPARRLRLGVFAGAHAGGRDEYAAATETLGRCLAGAGFDLVYGGAAVGLMAVVADSAAAAGANVTGVIPRFLVEREVANEALADLVVVDSLHERKAVMSQLSDAFVTIPGGLGTLDETMDALTWGQLGLHAKPLAVLNVSGYYDLLLDFLQLAHRHGFVALPPSSYLIVAHDAAELLDRLVEKLDPA